MPTAEPRNAEGPRLALAMADAAAVCGEYRRAIYWTEVAEGVLGQLPKHYRQHRQHWQALAAAARR